MKKLLNDMLVRLTVQRDPAPATDGSTSTDQSRNHASSPAEPMNDRPRQTLCQIVRERESHGAETGRHILEDRDLCEALLNDLCAPHKREIFVLVSALEAGVAGSLSSSRTELPLEAHLARLTKRLVDTRALSETAAQWAVESWALALGLVDVERGLTYLAQGRLRCATRELNTVVRVTPGSLRARVGLATAYQAQGLLDDAIREFDVALQIDPRCIEVRLALGDLTSERRLWGDAIRHYRAALKADPACAQAHLGLGRVYHRQGSLDNATRHLQAAVEKDPALGKARLYLGHLYWQREQLSLATEQYRSVVETYPDLLAEEAERCEQLDDLEKATAIYGLLAEAFPDNCRWKERLELTHDYSRAVTALRTGDSDQARRLLARVIARQPGYKKAARYLLQVVEDIDIDILVQQFDEHLAGTGLDQLRVSTRVHNLLAEAGVETASDVYKLLEQGDQALLRLDGFGARSLAELKAALPTFQNSLNGIEFRCLSPYATYADELQSHISALYDSIPLTVTGLSGAPLRALHRAGYRTVGDIHAEMLKGGTSLLAVRGFGKKSLTRLKEGFTWEPLPEF